MLRGAHYTDTGPCVFRDDVYVRHIIPACYVYATYVSDILYGSLLCTHVCVKLINVKPVHAALVEILPFHFSTKLVPKKQLVTVLQLLLNMLLGVDPLGGGSSNSKGLLKGTSLFYPGSPTMIISIRRLISSPDTGTLILARWPPRPHYGSPPSSSCPSSFSSS